MNSCSEIVFGTGKGVQRKEFAEKELEKKNGEKRTAKKKLISLRMEADLTGDYTSCCLGGGLFSCPLTIDKDLCPRYMEKRCSKTWDKACDMYAGVHPSFISDVEKNKKCKLVATPGSDCDVYCSSLDPMADDSPYLCRTMGTQCTWDCSGTGVDIRERESGIPFSSTPKKDPLHPYGSKVVPQVYFDGADRSVDFPGAATGKIVSSKPTRNPARNPISKADDATPADAPADACYDSCYDAVEFYHRVWMYLIIFLILAFLIYKYIR